MADLSNASASYKLFVQNAIDLAKTIVIKHGLVNDAINSALIYQGYSVNLSPASTDVNYETPWRTWKYYQNLAGLYYTDANGRPVDTAMTVLSVVGDGSVQPIAFDIPNLVMRPATLRAYEYGSYLYKALVQRFPLQEALIQGILDTATSIGSTAAISAAELQTITDGRMDSFYNATDGTIVAYSGQFIEVQETDLMSRLQTWVTMFFNDWFNTQYSVTDDLYVPTALGILYVMMPNVIMNIRLSNCHTIRAHSFHIQQYLESSGQLGQYVPYMNTQQMLWLYRNVKWVQRNAGRQSTFEALVANIMTAGNLPLSGYDIVHDLTPMANNQSLLPNVNMVSVPLNFLDTLNTSSNETVDYIVNKEVVFSRDQNLDVVDTETEITETMQTSVQSSMTTKVLESIYENTIDAVTFPLADILFDYWPYLASLGLYETDVYVTPPGTSAPILLSPINAFILYIYAWAYGNNLTANGGIQPGVPFTFQYIPQFRVSDVLSFSGPSYTLPTYSQAASVVDQSVLPIQYYGTDNKVMVAYANQTSPVVMDQITNWYTIDPVQKAIDTIALGLASTVFPVTSPDQFYTNCEIIQATEMASRAYAASANGYKACSELRFIGRLPYEDKLLTLAPYDPNNANYATQTLYSTWLQNIGVSFANMSQADANTFAYQILQQATGANLQGNYSIGDIQAAMLKVMQRLSSYTVQYIQTNNSTAAIVEDAAVVQVGKWLAVFGDDATVPLPTERLIDLEGEMADGFGLGLDNFSDDTVSDGMSDGMSMEFSGYVVPVEVFNDTIRVPLTARLNLRITDPSTIPMNGLTGTTTSVVSTPS